MVNRIIFINVEFYGIVVIHSFRSKIGRKFSYESGKNYSLAIVYRARTFFVEIEP